MNDSLTASLKRQRGNNMGYDKQERRAAREFKKYIREHPDEAFMVVTAGDMDPEPEFPVLRNCLGYSETAYFSMCNLGIERF
jgi:hypothetical protein